MTSMYLSSSFSISPRSHIRISSRYTRDAFLTRLLVWCSLGQSLKCCLENESSVFINLYWNEQSSFPFGFFHVGVRPRPRPVFVSYVLLRPKLTVLISRLSKRAESTTNIKPYKNEADFHSSSCVFYFIHTFSCFWSVRLHQQTVSNTAAVSWDRVSFFSFWNIFIFLSYSYRKFS